MLGVFSSDLRAGAGAARDSKRRQSHRKPLTLTLMEGDLLKALGCIGRMLEYVGRKGHGGRGLRDTSQKAACLRREGRHWPEAGMRV